MLIMYEQDLRAVLVTLWGCNAHHKEHQAVDRFPDVLNMKIEGFEFPTTVKIQLHQPTVWMSLSEPGQN